MSDKTGIEWTDATWNPIRGCSRVSEGCRHCYAESVAYRFSGERLDGKPAPYAGLVQRTPDGMRLPLWNGKIKFVEEHLLDPLRWKKGRRIFVNSMSDLFHENVTDEMLDRIFAVMALCPQHTFQVLTKRPERMLAYFKLIRGMRVMSKMACDTTAWHVWSQASAIQSQWKRPIPSPFMWFGEDLESIAGWPLPNVQLGVSVENQAAADLRIPLLLQTPAAVRFISAEPLLGAVDIDNLCAHMLSRAEGHIPSSEELEEPWKYSALHAGDMYWGGSGDISDGPEHGKLDWVIVGGESGAGARPMHPDWARSLRDQCVAAGVPFFFKQWGEWLPGQNDPYSDTRQCVAHHQDGTWGLKDVRGRGYVMWDEDGLLHEGGSRSYENHFPVHRWATRVGKKAAGALLDGREWREMPR